MIAEIAKMVARIPPDQLAIQLDIAQHVFKAVGDRRGRTASDGRAGRCCRPIAPWRSGGAMPLPPDSELLYHLCYGNNGRAPRRRSRQASTCRSAFANALSAGIGRSIDLIHNVGFRAIADDDAYFAPLRRLELRPETRIALGLVHATDGVEGSRPSHCDRGRNICRSS